jgi:hypothetical protein
MSDRLPTLLFRQNSAHPILGLLLARGEFDTVEFLHL